MAKLYYVLGFLFKDPNMNEVVMAQKQRPDFQAGKYNGIGGKIKDGETSFDAMTREFAEETGVATHLDDWAYRGVLTGPGWEVAIYSAANEKAFRSVQTKTDEPVGRYFVDHFSYHDLAPYTAEILQLLKCHHPKQVSTFKLETEFAK